MSRNSILWAAVIAAVLVVIPVGAVFFWPEHDAGKECCEQIREGMPWPQAEKILTDAGFEPWTHAATADGRIVDRIYKNKARVHVYVQMGGANPDLVASVKSAQPLVPDDRVDRFTRRLGWIVGK